MSKSEGIGSGVGISSLKPVNQHFSSRREQERHDQKPSKEVLQAFAELKAASESSPPGLEMLLDPNQQAVVVSMWEKGKRRILRLFPFEELIRLAQLAKSKRQHLLDRVL